MNWQSGCTKAGRYRPSEDNPLEISDERKGRIYSACRLILVVDEDTDRTEIDRLAERYGMKANALMSGSIYLFESPLPFSALDLSLMKTEIEQASFVRSVEYDYIIKLDDPVQPPYSDI